MDPERWRRIEQVYHSALERGAAEREGFLIEACQGDANLRREVESLLEHNGSTGALVDRTAWAAVRTIQISARSTMSARTTW